MFRNSIKPKNESSLAQRRYNNQRVSPEQVKREFAPVVKANGELEALERELEALGAQFKTELDAFNYYTRRMADPSGGSLTPDAEAKRVALKEKLGQEFWPKQKALQAQIAVRQKMVVGKTVARSLPGEPVSDMIAGRAANTRKSYP